MHCRAKDVSGSSGGALGDPRHFVHPLGRSAAPDRQATWPHQRPRIMREHVARRPAKRQRGATPKRPRPSRGKAQAEQSKSACTQRLRNNTPAGKPGTPRRNSLVHDSQPDDLQARRPNAVRISPGVNGSATNRQPEITKIRWEK
jgi:hypothetical protein